MEKQVLQQLINRIPAALALGAASLAAQAGPVQAPPLPPGSDRLHVEVGLSPDEVARHQRAHKHARLEKKDPTRDDSLNDLPVAPVKPKGNVPAPKTKPQPTIR